MLLNQMWLRLGEDLPVELEQSRDEGRNVDVYEQEVRKIQDMDLNNPKREKLAHELYDKLQALPVTSDHTYNEPSELDEIWAARPDKRFGKKIPEFSEDELYNRIYGAWLGRCAGCLLGMPIENWKRERILGLLHDTDNHPINYYISSNIDSALREKYDIHDQVPDDKYSYFKWINNVKHMPEDDDTNYTIIALKLIETYGHNFKPDDVAECWLKSIPILHTCTAERVAYRNFANLVLPPLSAIHLNPYREWIGAQIRADLYGYINPGDTKNAASMAWRDASISHVKNGIYGSMATAAKIAAAFVTANPREIILAAMGEIPEHSRLYECFDTVLNWHRDGVASDDALNRIHQMYDENNPHQWCHTNPNAMVVATAVLYGEMDLEKTIGLTIAAAFDTDCNAATAGSIVGAAIGAIALPKKWIQPLNDTISSGVDGFGSIAISELAHRTAALVKSE